MYAGRKLFLVALLRKRHKEMRYFVSCKFLHVIVDFGAPQCP